MILSLRPKLCPWVRLVCAASLCATPALAQAASGSEAHAAIASAMCAAGGSSTNDVGTVSSASVGQVLTGVEASSTSFKVQGSVGWMPPEIAGDNPILFGTRPSVGVKDGAQTINVLGFNFTAPGAGALNVRFDGVLGTATSVLTNLRASTKTPAGLSPLANPKGSVPVEIDTANGAHTVPNAFVYRPALVLRALPQVGHKFKVRLFTDNNALGFLVLGQIVSEGFGIPVLSFDGAAEVVINPQFVFSALPLPTGQHLHTATIPPNPTLAGKSIYFQGLAITDLPNLVGSFTNKVKLFIHP